VLNLAGNFGLMPVPVSTDGSDLSYDASSFGSPAGLDPNVVIIGGIAAVLALAWWMD
jgi:hypothetical protein